MRQRIVIAACCAVIGFVAAVLIAGGHLTRPAQVAIGPAPPALAAQSLRFASASGLTLSAWFAPGIEGRGAVLLLHGIRANKRSMLARALFLKRAGYAVLLVDLQAHGESEGDAITFGAREALDASAAVHKLRALAPGEKLGAIGVSLGAAALVLSDVHGELHAVVLESLYSTIEAAVANRLRLRLGPAGEWLAPLLVAQLGPRLGITPQALRPIDRVGELHAALLVAHGAEDRHTTIAEARHLFERAQEPKTLYVVPGAAHVDLHRYAPAQYEQRVGALFARHLQSHQ